MCVVSNVYDHYSDRWRIPTTPPAVPTGPVTTGVLNLGMTREQVRQIILRELEQFKKDMLAALRQDEEEGNPDCGSASKRLALQTIADEYGVDLEEVIESLSHLE